MSIKAKQYNGRKKSHGNQGLVVMARDSLQLVASVFTGKPTL